MGKLFSCVDPVASEGPFKGLSSEGVPNWLVMPFEVRKSKIIDSCEIISLRK